MTAAYAALAGRPMALLAALGLAGALVLLLLLWAALAWRRRRESSAGRATHRTLHAVSSAAGHLQDGLTPEGAASASAELRDLLGVTAVAVITRQRVLAWSGAGEHHAAQLLARADPVFTAGDTVVLEEDVLTCGDPDCRARSAVIVPVAETDISPAALVTVATSTSADLVRSTEALGGWLASQAHLAELALHRTRTAEAELSALRAQVNPHFIYNSLAAIAAFVRTDPPRARELLLDFADFTRYALRGSGELTALGDEYTNVDRYLVLEKARFGEKLEVRSQIDPDVLDVDVPFLTIQPLVENAVQHGIEQRVGRGTVTISARAVPGGVQVTVSDDGLGADEARLRALISGADPEHVGLANVDARLRRHFGETAALHVSSAPGSGTTVRFTVPRHPH